ncbi:hypothetical protein D3OALGA1CA_326 [Olavius algarvensis associated proteobacterium Delta 3]|nr:hypothetical protein D3OALGA1CA_326 [Olavius algarvensis associated proteobacterium Delta 3]CAB5097903.1 hypothetical protein D3OALGB2SA_1634 [Olavius algarvensis associated proteobacterium Delta 3]
MQGFNVLVLRKMKKCWIAFFVLNIRILKWFRDLDSFPP